MTDDKVTRKIEMAHERWLREQDLLIAKVDAKKEVDVAKVGNVDWVNGRTIIRVVAWVVILIIFICGSITYCGAPTPFKEKNKQEKYELCMQIEKDHERCS